MPRGSRTYAARLVTAMFALVGLVAIEGGQMEDTHAAFSGSTGVGAPTLTSAPDWVAPTVGANVVAKDPVGYIGGFVRAGGSYRVYGQVTDTGNPASGTSTVRSNTVSLTAGATAAALTSGAFTMGAGSYNWRGAAQTVAAGTTAGAKTWTVAMTDAAANAGTSSNLSVTVDNTVPSASDIQCVNVGGGTAGLAQLGDSIVYTSSEQIEPFSILANWTGAATNVVVRIVNQAGGDRVRIFNAANTTQLPIGEINLGNTGYVTTTRTFGATGTPSTMTKSGSVITVVLGTASGAVGTVAATGNAVWTPVATATDPAGNAMSTTARTETGAADTQF